MAFIVFNAFFGEVLEKQRLVTLFCFFLFLFYIYSWYLKYSLDEGVGAWGGLVAGGKREDIEGTLLISMCEGIVNWELACEKGFYSIVM